MPRDVTRLLVTRIKMFRYFSMFGKTHIFRATLSILSAIAALTVLGLLFSSSNGVVRRAASGLLDYSSSSSAFLRSRTFFAAPLSPNDLGSLKSTCVGGTPDDCRPGVPCSYGSPVDFRIIPIAFDRARSLYACLESLRRLDTLGDQVAVDIWLDVRRNSTIVDNATYAVALRFIRTWTKGPACVHVQASHAYINGQWIDTWRPRGNNTREIALILEDDVSISSQTYRWLKAVHREYDGWTNISGYTLQMEGVTFFAPERRAMSGPPNDSVFMYPVLGTWGFSPHPGSWRLFQDWYHEARKNRTLRPYVPGIVPTSWYMSLEREGREESMWEMWHIYFAYVARHWCVYPNLVPLSGRQNVLLSTNRQEPGLHFFGSAINNTENLLTIWNENFAQFPKQPVIYSYEGSNLNV